MFKKIFLIALTVVVCHIAQAETWKLHPQFASGNVKNCIDAGDDVYCLVGYTLYSYNKASEQITHLSKDNGLSDVLVTAIYYNPDNDYLVIVYDNSNIDIITSEKRIVNISAINDAVISSSKAINDITFGTNHRMYVATDFGYVSINDENMTVDEFRDYHIKFWSIASVRNGLAACAGSQLRYSATKSPEKFDEFVDLGMIKQRDTCVYTNNNKGKATTLTSARLFPMNESSVLLTTTTTLDSTYFKRVTINVTDTGTTATLYQYIRYAPSVVFQNIQKSPTGFIANAGPTTKTYYTLTSNGVTFRGLNGVGAGFYSSNPHGDGSLWGFGASGVFKNVSPAHYVMPEAVTLALPYWVAMNPANGGFLVTNTANTTTLQTSPTNSTQFTACKYDGEHWNPNGALWPANPKDITEKNTTSGYRPIYDPNDSSTYYVGTWFAGVLKVQNDSVVLCFNQINSPMSGTATSPNYYYCVRCAFDRKGNLWAIRMDDQLNHQVNMGMMLPKDKLHGDSITKQDWYSYYLPGVELTQGSKFNSFDVSTNNVKAYSTGGYGKPIYFWKGDDIESPFDVKSATEFLDQNGNLISLTSDFYHTNIAADSVGNFWLTYNSEIYIIDANTIFDDDVIHMVKPRSITGDDLITTASINGVFVDCYNRKWVTTSDEGVYVINDESNEILMHFDTGNSSLPSNTVYCATFSPVTNSALITTANGIVECLLGEELSTAAEVKAYPNPVMPTYTGLVTIEGAPRGSQVRIDNRRGETVAEFTVTTATALWDTCGSDGQRVATGVYDIYVARPNETYPEQPQAILRIVK